MAPPCTHSPPGCPDGPPPRTTVSSQSALARAGTTACGAGPAPSNLECGADPGSGWPGGALAVTTGSVSLRLFPHRGLELLDVLGRRLRPVHFDRQLVELGGQRERRLVVG